jgi:hypothetical protein
MQILWKTEEWPQGSHHLILLRISIERELVNKNDGVRKFMVIPVFQREMKDMSISILITNEAPFRHRNNQTRRKTCNVAASLSKEQIWLLSISAQRFGA